MPTLPAEIFEKKSDLVHCLHSECEEVAGNAICLMWLRFRDMARRS